MYRIELVAYPLYHGKDPVQTRLARAITHAA